MKDRLERSLIDLAKRHAPQIVPSHWSRPGDYTRPIPELARLLAASGALPLLGDVPVPFTNEAGVHLKLWVDTYTRMYQTLTSTLFSSHSGCSAFYADNEWPPLVAIVGTAAPVLAALGAYIAPFVAVRQGGQAASEIELRVLAEVLLEELEAHTIPPEEYQRLRMEMVSCVKDLLALQVRQMPLTPAAPNLFSMSAPPAAPPAEPPPPAPERPGGDLGSGRRRSGKRRPPIPDLPDDSE
jgi:hypothetical protein